MKRLYKRLAATYLVSAMLFVLIFAVILYIRGRDENGYYLYQLLGGVDGNLEDITEEYESSVKRLSEEYIKHAREVSSIIAADAAAASPSGLETLRIIMGTGPISLISPSGEIMVSTDESLQGTQEDGEIISRLKASGEKNAAAVNIDEPDFWERPGYFRVTVRSDSTSFFAVRIDGDLTRLQLTSGSDRVSSILRRATTEYDTSIFAAGKARGKILGITKNNRQDIHIENVSEGKQLLDFLSLLSEGRPVVLRINGAYQIVVIRERHDMYLAAFTGMEEVMANVAAAFAIGLSSVAVITVMTILIVRFYIQKYVFAHFEKIREGILRVLRGEGSIREDDSEVPELAPLLEMISRLGQEYVRKSEGMNQMEDQLSAARNAAEYDRLTGLYNRNGFERRAEAFFHSRNSCGALLLFDLDNFKRVNDTEGHPAGDRLLVLFSRRLSDTFTQGEVIGRLGGDEFIVLIPGAVSVEVVKARLQKLYDSIRTGPGGGAEKDRISVSAGAVLAGSGPQEYSVLYQLADTALYKAKRLGKNQFYINVKIL